MELAIKIGERYVPLHDVAYGLFNEVRNTTEGDGTMCISLPLGYYIRTPSEWRKIHPEEAKLIDAGNVLMRHVLKFHGYPEDTIQDQE